ncbi:MAG: MOSC domain-containing protein [Nitrospira sp. WS238]|nr:MOSC domain-containing protein [Nitrospira sp. WS238]
MSSLPEAIIVSLQVGLPCAVEVGNPDGLKSQGWTTGFFKHPLADPVWLSTVNLAGDGQADLKNHGGLDKAVNVYPHEHYPYWMHTLGFNELPPAALGENFTTNGLFEDTVCIGDTFAIGEAMVQVSQPRQPCWKLARRWNIKDLALRVQDTGRTGWYFRVLREGMVQVRNTFLLVNRPHPEWTVSRANLVMHNQTVDIDATQELANCQALSSRWKIKLRQRASTGTMESHAARLYGPNSEVI